MKKTVPIEFPGLAELFALPGGLMASEGGVACLQKMRAQSAESSAQLDCLRLEHVANQRRCLSDAKDQIRKVQSILETLSAPPWHPAIFHQMVSVAGGGKADVQIGASRRVVSLQPMTRSTGSSPATVRPSTPQSGRREVSSRARTADG